jgi:hypothetical protein
MDISVNEINLNDSNIDSNIDSNNSDINIIMRQTNYTREEACKLFSELGSVEKCIHHYLGIKPKEEPNISTNQKIFKSIRDFF